ncbi:hypothetical protein PPSIR1_02773 [Plesiocystis pacifica SIR-1]|uniref:Peptidase S8/S53 domain-containing protein n=1 Tax=Plesiocystis pacifica SIR-1 TaxID=391625 RepID=A6G925_9BACT|nr:S8/S53 family peptidase [Plesiocystis pacifica]EDM77573.1 hypothetical protein PPSIR1_02773 [Plesiocystis pacifica SIR-1]
MNTTTKFGVILASAMLLGACDSGEAPGSELELGEPGASAEAGEAMDAAEDDALPLGGRSQHETMGAHPPVECPGTRRVIGVLIDPDEGSCDGFDIPNEWVGSEMFSTGSPHVAGLSGPVPDGLRRFCMFEWQPSYAPVDDGMYASLFDAIDNYSMMPLEFVAPDCLGEYVQGDLSDEGNVRALRDAFLANVDALSAAEAESLPVAGYPGVGVIDSLSQEAAELPWLTPVSDHGDQMGELIRDVLCPHEGKECTQSVEYSLALDRSERTGLIDWYEGGSLGSQGSLALAIYYYVKAQREAWEADPDAVMPRMVLNLSVGWSPDPALYDTVLDPDRGPKQALEEVLRYASCQGALVFTAAGNNPDEACPGNHVGGLAPATYEGVPAPEPSYCKAMDFWPADEDNYPVFPKTPTYRPLVYAVGGVDGHDEALINARLKGTPRQVATGSSGVAMDDAGVLTTPLSGSSVATAAVTAAAAQLISVRPDLTPAEVAEAVWERGWAIGETSDFQLGAANLPVRRLSVCGAIAPEVPWLTCSAEAPDPKGNLGDYSSEVQAVLNDPTTNMATSVQPVVDPNPVCEVISWNELVRPQPETPICPHCNIQPGGGEETDDAVNMTIDTAYAGFILDVELTATDELMNVTTVNLGSQAVADLNAGFRVVRVMVDTPGVTRASLEFTVSDPTGNIVQTNPIDVL